MEQNLETRISADMDEFLFKRIESLIETDESFRKSLILSAIKKPLSKIVKPDSEDIISDLSMPFFVDLEDALLLAMFKNPETIMTVFSILSPGAFVGEGNSETYERLVNKHNHQEEHKRKNDEAYENTIELADLIDSLDIVRRTALKHGHDRGCIQFLLFLNSKSDKLIKHGDRLGLFSKK